MKIKYHGGAAFPFEWRDQQGINQCAPGMTLRDYFAAKAMVTQLSQYEVRGEQSELIARNAYIVADAMLKARSE